MIQDLGAESAANGAESPQTPNTWSRALQFSRKVKTLDCTIQSNACCGSVVFQLIILFILFFESGCSSLSCCFALFVLACVWVQSIEKREIGANTANVECVQSPLRTV